MFKIIVAFDEDKDCLSVLSAIKSFEMSYLVSTFQYCFIVNFQVYDLNVTQ